MFPAGGIRPIEFRMQLAARTRAGASPPLGPLPQPGSKTISVGPARSLDMARAGVHFASVAFASAGSALARLAASLRPLRANII